MAAGAPVLGAHSSQNPAPRGGSTPKRAILSLRDLSFISLALIPQAATAHVAVAPANAPFLHLDFWLGPMLWMGLLAYGLGLCRLWRGGSGRGVSGLRACAFAAGWTVLALSLIGPLDRWAAASLAAHVSQHMLLMTVVPPLMLLGLPGVVLIGLLPSRAARVLTRPMNRWRQAGFWRRLSSLGGATLIQAAVMWGWHLPAAMALALHSDAVHWLMHLSFLAVGLWFWAALLHGVREPRYGAGMSAIAIVGSMISMGLLGALMTFADTPRYPTYIEHAQQFGYSALEDQQLAGLIMWVPSSLPYLMGGLAIVALWMRRSDRRA